MELGNMIFGNSRGEHPVDRGLQDEFCEWLERLGFDSYGNKDDHEDWAFENDTFRIQPYYWGDCECGYERREHDWCEANDHEASCYQTALRDAMKRWEDESGYTAADKGAFGDRGDDLMSGFTGQGESDGIVTAMVWTPRKDAAMETWRKLSDRRDKYRDRVYRELCGQFGLPYPHGCAVHCTCNYRQRWEHWASANDHAADCHTVTPNFLHKPSGFRLDWYKYPLRDSYSSAPLTAELMRSMFRDCATSLGIAQKEFP